MEPVMAVLVGIMVAGSVYLILGRNLIRFIFGLVLASNAVNLLLFTGGRLAEPSPPLIPEGSLTPAGPVANALPQALMLTAIVIGFALLVFIFVLFYRAYQEIGTVDTEFMRLAEPVDDVTPAPACPIDTKEA
ncbi:MAG: Na+/H+ antiporter subunit C [Desulfobacterales bacterium]|nr:Na+/H+ antiporter subunit C [Desulfobacterales bacterium]MDJ0854557.1 Na+/H+ antiporter subunit C [Desulfobacterales bacterium]MDJ0886325.1 Na+/H+ antiporter subunit C [Desulfobacterales bacterium]MDJ0990504.1 Na+/H+ antiporter subunit C [Desulfobacterales bacterium]